MNEKEEPQPISGGGNTEVKEPRRDLRLVGAQARTAMSSEQTLKSWVRTSVSLFTFGFTITQFFYYLDQRQEGVQLSAGPRRLGLALICLGIFALVLGMIEHVLRLRRLQNQGLRSSSRYLLPVGSAMLLLAIGIAALISILLIWAF